MVADNANSRRASLRDAWRKLRDDRRGQSIVEFLFMLPVLIGMTTILVRVNTLIQMAIVDQQWARAHALFLTFNSAWYPEAGFVDAQFVKKQMNRMILGVSDNNAPLDGASSYSPSASKYRITRSKSAARGASDDSSAEPDKRADVRIRDTVTLCTPSHLIQGPSGPVANLPGLLKDPLSPSAFIYCRSPINE